MSTTVKNLQKEIDTKKANLVELQTTQEIAKKTLASSTQEITSLKRDITALEIALSVV